MSSKIFIASFLAVLALLANGSVWAAGEMGDLTIRRAPPAPPLPPKGGVFKDPTYGTSILRVTDRTDGANAGHAYSLWSPFNFNSTRFHIAIDGTWTLYDFDPINFRSRKVGPITSSGIALNLEAARWHHAKPDVLYALEPSTQRRRVFALNVVTGIPTLIHDFTGIAPLGGYPNSLSMSENGQVLTFYSSTTGGQDTGDVVVAYNLQTNTVYSLDFKGKTGLSNIHSTFLDKSGAYVVIHAGTSSAEKPVYWIWDFVNATLETLLWNSSDSPGGHWAFGSGLTINPSSVGGEFVRRQLATPHTVETVFVLPQRDGAPNYQVDSHRSWNNLDSRFFFYSNHILSTVTGWVLHSGAIYKRTNFLNTLTARAPEGVYVNGVSLVESLSMPSAAGQWYYDAAATTLYVWLLNDAAATDSTNVIVPFAWWPLMEEIFQVWVDDPANLTKFRRLAHHQSHIPNTAIGGYADLPKASADRSGRYVMFTSNWGGSGHRDVFILQVPTVTNTTAPGNASPSTPRNLSVK